MKKRILIINNNMHIGGVQKALVNLLKETVGDFDITLFLFYPFGKLMSEIPDDVKIISPGSPYKYIGMLNYDVKGNPFAYFLRSFWALMTRIFGRTKVLKFASKFQKNLEGYDVAVSYLHNGAEKAFYGGCNDFVIHNVKADKKISLLHCDYNECGANTENNAKMYSEFDIIAACSEGCRNSFVAALPAFSEKTKVLYNCHDYNALSKLAADGNVTLSNNCLNILTVARFGREKGILRALHVISRLSEEQKNKIKYYIIGDGIQMPDALAFIKDKRLEDTVFCLGEMSNPYGYIKAADLLLISSYSEAAPLVIGEAAYFSTPILSTKTSSAVEMIEKTGCGWVVDNDEESLHKKLCELIDSPEVIKNKRNSLNVVFNNELAMKQFKSLIE
ncbi:MAG: glycosyltransferase [Ruminococcaceae bacterium]|nr:glycosyltransferase [Oscillospiraceae bacterium]